MSHGSEATSQPRKGSPNINKRDSNSNFNIAKKSYSSVKTGNKKQIVQSPRILNIKTNNLIENEELEAIAEIRMTPFIRSDKSPDPTSPN
jgi:hypothetical protein